jgi:hypothetical protein
MGKQIGISLGRYRICRRSRKHLAFPGNLLQIRRRCALHSCMGEGKSIPISRIEVISHRLICDVKIQVNVKDYNFLFVWKLLNFSFKKWSKTSDMILRKPISYTRNSNRCSSTKFDVKFPLGQLHIAVYFHRSISHTLSGHAISWRFANVLYGAGTRPISPIRMHIDLAQNLSHVQR